MPQNSPFPTTSFPLNPSSVPVSVAEYASISQNIPKYLWKFLNKLFWLCQGSEYAWSSYMFDRLLKMPRVLNVTGFWILHNYICKSYTVLNMSEYGLICLNNAWIYLNAPQYVWSWQHCLNVPEYAWINCFGYVRILSMAHHLRYLTDFWVCLRH